MKANRGGGGITLGGGGGGSSGGSFGGDGVDMGRGHASPDKNYPQAMIPYSPKPALDRSTLFEEWSRPRRVSRYAWGDLDPIEYINSKYVNQPNPYTPQAMRWANTPAQENNALLSVLRGAR
jgi:hypothetical protein